MRWRRTRSEENGDSGNEEKGKQGRDEDPVRKQTTETGPNSARSAASTAPDGDSH